MINDLGKANLVLLRYLTLDKSIKEAKNLNHLTIYPNHNFQIISNSTAQSLFGVNVYKKPNGEPLQRGNLLNTISKS